MISHNKQIRFWVCGKLGHEKPDCRLIHEIPKEKWWRNKNKSEKKKFNDQMSVTSNEEASDSEYSDDSSDAGDVVASHSRDHTFGWSRVNLRHKSNVSSCEKQKPKSKLTGVCGVAKQTKIKVNHQMNDVILLDSVSQVTIFKQKHCVNKMFGLKGKCCAHSSGDGELCSYLR